MPFCTHCGQKFDDNLNTCPNCGADNKAKTDSDFDVKDIYNMAFDTEDTTASVDAKDISANKGITILSYIGPLAFIPYFTRKDSKFAHYHSSRGLNLFIIQAIVSVVLGILGAILGKLGFIGNLINWLVSTPVNLLMLAFSVIGIINVAKGRCKELPFISKIKFVK